MRFPFVFLALFVALGGCRSSGESDLERQLADDPPPGACKTALAANFRDEASDFYLASVYPVLQNDCMDCHVASGDAGDSALVLAGDANDDYSLVREFT